MKTHGKRAAATFIGILGVTLASTTSAADADESPRTAGTDADALIALLRERWVFADRVEWAAAETALRERWTAATNDRAQAEALVPLFAQVNDVHSTVRTGDRTIGHFEPVAPEELERLRPLLERERAQAGRPAAAIVDGDIGYLLVPGNSASTTDEMIRAARDIRAAIASVAPRVDGGWIVDLRLNGGGNLVPMLLGLAPLLGDGVAGGTMDRDGAMVQCWVIDGDTLRWRDATGERVFLTLEGDGDDDRGGTPAAARRAPSIVVLTGPTTRSSGQGAALAFAGSKGATSVGEPTARGYTTVTAPFDVGASQRLSLAVGFMTDRDGNRSRERTEPEHRVLGADDFDRLDRDPKVRRAIELLRGIAAPPASGAYDPLLRDSAAIEHVDLVVVDEERGRDLPLRIYLPAPRNGGPAPVVLFSHGLGGSCRNNPYLGEHWAARGYVAVFMQHPGSDESVWRDARPAQRMAAMRDAASAANLLLRVKDVPVVLDQLARWNVDETHALAGRLDLDRVGMSGHSFGARTTQSVSGQTEAIGEGNTDARIKAAVAMSPSAPQRLRAGAVDRAFASVRIPWLLMTGTNDTAPIGDQTVESRLAVFPALPPGDKYELVLDGAEHSAFGEERLRGDREQRHPNHHRAILAITTAFWDAYLRGEERAKAWLESDGASTGVRSVLEPADRWQRK